MEIENLKHIGQKLISAVVPGNSCDIEESRNEGLKRLKALDTAVIECQNIFGGKTILATDENIRVINMCDQWVRTLSHGLKVPVSTYQPIQNIITASLNFAFNLNLFDVSLWDYTRIHLTKHEEERFKLLKNINTPMGHFRAFLRSALNERSLERYIRSWISHSLIVEYYEDWAIVRNSNVSHQLADMSTGLMSILFALSIDKPELNDSQSPMPQLNTISEPVIAISAPIVKNMNKKTLRQVISFDSADERRAATINNDENKVCNGNPTDGDPKMRSSMSVSGISNLNHHTGSVNQNEQIVKETPREILTKLTEKAKDIFSGKKLYDSLSHHGSDMSSVSGDKKFSESDIEDIVIESGIPCLELTYHEDDSSEIVNGSLEDVSEKQNSALQMRIIQMENEHKEKIRQMEKIISTLTNENQRLSGQLKNYVSAVKTLDQDNIENEEIKHYEKKLVQVAQMHAELMEFNNVLQQQLQEATSRNRSNDSIPGYQNTTSQVHILIPSTYLVTKGSKSFHVYQIYLKVQTEEWNVYRRYSEFRKLYHDLKNTHPNMSSFKFPPKRVIGKKEAWLVEQRRGILQAWLRHIVETLPQLQRCTKKADLITMLPFFGETDYSENSDTLRPILST